MIMAQGIDTDNKNDIGFVIFFDLVKNGVTYGSNTGAFNNKIKPIIFFEPERKLILITCINFIDFDGLYNILSAYVLNTNSGIICR
jgi:hypothetical protein